MRTTRPRTEVTMATMLRARTMILKTEVTMTMMLRTRTSTMMLRQCGSQLYKDDQADDTSHELPPPSLQDTLFARTTAQDYVDAAVQQARRGDSMTSLFLWMCMSSHRFLCFLARLPNSPSSAFSFPSFVFSPSASDRYVPLPVEHSDSHTNN